MFEAVGDEPLYPNPEPKKIPIEFLDICIPGMKDTMRSFDGRSTAFTIKSRVDITDAVEVRSGSAKRHPPPPTLFRGYNHYSIYLQTNYGFKKRISESRFV